MPEPAPNQTDLPPRTPPSEHLIGPDLSGQATVFVRGEGVELIDSDGRRYLDAMSGVGVTCLGYGVSEIVEAMRAQAEELPYLHALRFEAPSVRRLADLVAEISPGDLDHVFFASGGAEANESAIKFIRQYWVDRGQPNRWRIIGRKPSYHGNTLATLSVGWHEARRRLYTPLLLPMQHVQTPNTYRGCDHCRLIGHCTMECVSELERQILQAGPESVAAFIAEPVVAAAGGGLIPPPGYFAAVREICDRYGVLLVADEVFTGFGRLGSWFGVQRLGVEPDVLVFAKGITAGYLPLGGFVARGTLLEPIRNASGRFDHNFTFAGHPVAAAVGVAVIGILRRERLVERVATVEPTFFGLLNDHLGKNPIVGDIRGMGMFAGVELVADKHSKRPFTPATNVAARAAKLALDEGVIVYPCSGSTAEEASDSLLVAPPYVITESDLERMATRLARALHRLERELA